MDSHLQLKGILLLIPPVIINPTSPDIKEFPLKSLPFAKIPAPIPVPRVIAIKLLESIALPLNFSAKATQLASFSISVLTPVKDSNRSFKG